VGRKIRGAIGVFIKDRERIERRRWFGLWRSFFLHLTRQFRILGRWNKVLIIRCTISDHCGGLFN